VKFIKPTNNSTKHTENLDKAWKICLAPEPTGVLSLQPVDRGAKAGKQHRAHVAGTHRGIGSICKEELSPDNPKSEPFPVFLRNPK